MAGNLVKKKPRKVHQNLKRILRAEHPLELRDDVRIFCWYDRYVVIAEVPSRRPIVKVDPYEGTVSIFHYYDINPRIEINIRWALDCLNLPYELEVNEKRDKAKLIRRSDAVSPWTVEIQGFPPGLRNPRRLNHSWKRWYEQNNKAKPGKGLASNGGISVLGMHDGDNPTPEPLGIGVPEIVQWANKRKYEISRVDWQERLEAARKRRDELSIMVMKHYHPELFK